MSNENAVSIDKRALAVSLCEELAAVSNRHVKIWRELMLTPEDTAGMLTGALVNIMANTAISLSSEYINVAERMCYSVMNFVHNHRELMTVEADKAKAN